jgi:RNA recognition motif-containing protein
MTNHDLHELFKPHGNILSVSIKTEEDTGRGKGFGFVTFETAESAASAIQHLNGYQVRVLSPSHNTSFIVEYSLVCFLNVYFPSTLRYMANV